MSRDRSYTMTYDIVTPESAEQGDMAENGFIDIHGNEIPLDGRSGKEATEYLAQFDIDIDLEEAINEAMLDDDLYEMEATIKVVGEVIRNELGSAEASESGRGSAPSWYSQTDGDEDYRTGATTRKAIHLDGFDRGELAEIYTGLRKRKVVS